ncbi:MAG: bifunctional riboflavin kinase/FAD synthetase [Bacteroidia bacterium]
MKVYRSLVELPKIQNAVVTQGTFDGVHSAHQVIINQLKNIAKTNRGETVLITYNPHPRMVLYPNDHGLKLLNTLDEKIELLAEHGINHLVILPFTLEFSRLSSLQFIRDIIVNKIGTKFLVIGYNHRFGRNREGSFEHLKEFSGLYGFDVIEIPEHDVNNVSVSSTKIREALMNGDIKAATASLCKPYSLTGIVVEGNKLGVQIGYPTANIFVSDENKLIPADGVYAVWVKHNNQKFGGMLNIGNNPTIPNKGRSIEVNIFNFNQNIYNQNITVQFVDKLRNETKFKSLDDLKTQLAIDKLQAQQVLQIV